MDRQEALDAYVGAHRSEIERKVQQEVVHMKKTNQDDSWLYFEGGCRVLISWDQYDDGQPPYFQVFAYPPDGDLDDNVRLSDYK